MWAAAAHRNSSPAAAMSTWASKPTEADYSSIGERCAGTIGRPSSRTTARMMRRVLVDSASAHQEGNAVKESSLLPLDGVDIAV
jgi:hypothetical protein